jgi:threonyl-tRNA synthetase
MDGRSGRRPVRDEQVFNKGLRSWHGLMRTHAFEQDDANVFCREEVRLDDAARESRVAYSVQPGAGAVYGPKLEFALRDR